MANARSKTAEARAQNYKAAQVWKKNRTLKLERALKKNPGNEAQITTAMGSMVYRRKTPKTKVWSASKRREAIVMSRFKLPKGYVLPMALQVNGSMYSIGNRIGL